MHIGKRNLRKCARGTYDWDTPGWSNTPVTALFNDSPGPELLLVHAITTSDDADNKGPISAGYFYGLIGTLNGNSPIFPGQAVAGQISFDDTTTIYTPDWFFGTQGMGSVKVYSTLDGGWPHEYPFAVLPPGWSLFTQNLIAGEAAVTDFWWEAIYAERFEYLYGSEIEKPYVAGHQK